VPRRLGGAAILMAPIPLAICEAIEPRFINRSTPLV